MSHYGDIFPTLSDFDVQRVAQLIEQAYAPPTPATTPDDLRRLQQELFEIQKRPEAWGLVVPLMSHTDPNVQFFGAHTAQVKIARDWDMFPQHLAEALPNAILSLTQNAISVRCPKFVLRKLFVALASLALKLVPGHPSRWRDWILQVTSADLVGPNAANDERVDVPGSGRYQQHDYTPIRFHPASQYTSALRCLQAWMSYLKAKADHELGARRRVRQQDADGAAPRVAGHDGQPHRRGDAGHGRGVRDRALAVQAARRAGRPLDRVLAAHIASGAPVPTAPGAPPTTRGRLVQRFLQLLLVYTGLPGYYGVDEDESEMTLGFWYLFQEALWSTDFFVEEEGEEARCRRRGRGRVAAGGDGEGGLVSSCESGVKTLNLGAEIA
ncbi:hypothetical protein BJ912DRAFT_1069769 [Pholiota molesta]|nr:hypothetical protein BJ912DRAFT_1069769 [Pholiota molesta]